MEAVHAAANLGGRRKGGVARVDKGWRGCDEGSSCEKMIKSMEGTEGIVNVRMDAGRGRDGA